MCGIVGFVTTQRIDPTADAVILRRMLDALRHRGPDDSGQFLDANAALAHARLSIIDLSPAGRQPMANENGSVHVVFNGEIYNFRALRNELAGAGHRFTSQSDTEVLLHGYEQWGLEELLARLEGMFAFALWDTRQRQLHLARDPFGIKPLFYTLREGRLVFASEIQGLIAHDAKAPPMDAASLLLSLQHLGVPAPATMYQGYRQLEPGTWLTFDAGGSGMEGTQGTAGTQGTTQSKRYWSWRIDPQINDPETAAAELWPVIVNSVEKHLIADVPVGLFLSGGIDSGLIAAACAELGAKPDCLTIAADDPEYDESPLAALVCQKFGLPHRIERLAANDAKPIDAELARIYGEPFATSAALSAVYISRVAAKTHKVMLGGDGGDELFGGYGWFSDWLEWYGPEGRRIPLWSRPFNGLAALLGRTYDPADPIEGYAQLHGCFSDAQMAGLFDPDFLARHAAAANAAAAYRAIDRPELRGFDRVQWLDLHLFLPTECLTKMDRAAMAQGLEVRVPLLDKTVAELAGRISVAARNPEGERKGLLRRIARDKLPPDLLDQPKQGFSMPTRRWFPAEMILQDIAAGIKRSDAWRGIFSASVVEGAARLRGRRLWRFWHIWRWVMES